MTRYVILVAFLGTFLVAGLALNAQDASPADTTEPNADTAAPAKAEAAQEDTAPDEEEDARDVPKPVVGAKTTDKEYTAFDELMDKIHKGGIVMYIILALSIAGLTFVLERACHLRQKAIVPEGFADTAADLWEQGKLHDLRSKCEADKSVIAKVIGAIVDHRASDVTDIQTIAGDLGTRGIQIHLQRAYPLAVVATLAPLLGLLGTIFGMIGAFDTVAGAGEMGDPSLLADDIAKALVTTAGGLSVAIPCLLFYHLFKSRTLAYGVVLEGQVSDLISRWFMKISTPTNNTPAADPTPGGQEGTDNEA